MEKKMTIIMAVKDREQSVAAALDSIFSQSYRPFSLIITDNGSTDRTSEIIANWAERHRSDDFDIKIIKEEAPGASKARNRGLEAAQTEYVMFFDSDDIMEFDHLERIMKHLDRFPETELLHWGIAIRDSDGWTTQKFSRHDNDLLAEHILYGTLATARFCVRKETLRKSGAWNEDLSTWDDLELGVRLINNIEPKKIHRLNGPARVIAIAGENTLTGKTFSSRSEAHKRSLEKIEENIGDDQRYGLIIDARRAILAAEYRREGSADLSARELKKALDGRSFREILKLRSIYSLQKVAGRGGSALTLWMFPAIKENEKQAEIG